MLLAVSRIDLVPEADRAAVLAHIQAGLSAMLPGELEIFTTDARAAVKTPDADTLGVREVRRLRERLQALAGRTGELAPARARTYLSRSADLLAHHAATLARALRLERAAVESELAEVKKAFLEQRMDVEQLRATIAGARADIARNTSEHLATFRGELQAAILGQLERADLRATADLLPSAAQDALMHFVFGEAERLRLALEKLTRDVLRTCGEQAQRRLAAAMLTLGLRGPVVHLRPPSVLLEASTLVVGMAGTAVMYFGNVIAGLTMTVAAPLATMFLRERSVRELRESARQSVPAALAATFTELEKALLHALDDHVAALDEILVLAHTQLGEQLSSLLQRVLDLDGPPQVASGPSETAPVPSGSDARKLAAADLRVLEPELEKIRAELAALPIGDAR